MPFGGLVFPVTQSDDNSESVTQRFLKRLGSKYRNREMEQYKSYCAIFLFYYIKIGNIFYYMKKIYKYYSAYTIFYT